MLQFTDIHKNLWNNHRWATVLLKSYKTIIYSFLFFYFFYKTCSVSTVEMFSTFRIDEKCFTILQCTVIIFLHMFYWHFHTLWRYTFEVVVHPVYLFNETFILCGKFCYDELICDYCEIVGNYLLNCLNIFGRQSDYFVGVFASLTFRENYCRMFMKTLHF